MCLDDTKRHLDYCTLLHAHLPSGVLKIHHTPQAACPIRRPREQQKPVLRARQGRHGRLVQRRVRAQQPVGGRLGGRRRHTGGLKEREAIAGPPEAQVLIR